MDTELKIGIWAIVVVLLLAFGGMWFSSSMEARSYRKFCDTEVTWWDAVWLDLRIDECSGGPSE